MDELPEGKMCFCRSKSQQANKLALLQQSFFPSTIKLWNTLDLNIRQIPILAHFKIANNDPHFRFGIHIYSLDLKLN
jgi:hypothetical protein